MKPEKQITLFAVGLIVLALFFLLPRNGQWMGERVIPYWRDWQSQKGDLSEEGRKVKRYRGAYTYSKQIAGLFPDKSQALVLVPSAAYFKNHGLNYEVPEPAVFYYFTGLKTTWASSPMATQAGFIIGFENGKFIAHRVTSPQQVSDSIASFKKYPYGL